jgi:hypothetical protein
VQPDGVFCNVMSTDAPDASAPEMGPNDVIYIVRPGDTLGAIALRVYGRVAAYKLIYDANVGRRQPDGLTFTRAGQIFPGWLLILPNAAPDSGATADSSSTVAADIETDADGQRWYTVRRGDSLASISRRLLGDEEQWRELFELNKSAQLPNGWTLTRPQLIWPGLRLRLPPVEPDADDASEADQPSEPEAPAVPADEALTPPADEATTPPPPSPSPTEVEPSPTAVPQPTVAPTPSVAPVPPVIAATPIPVPTQPAGTARTSTGAPNSPVAPAWAQLHWPLLDLPPADSSWPLELGGALLGASLLLIGRSLRSGRAPVSRFETGIEVSEGFAQAVGGDEADYEQPLATLAEHVLDFAGEHGSPSVRLRGGLAGRTKATLLLEVPVEFRPALVSAAAAFGARPDAVQVSTLTAGTMRWDQDWSTGRPRRVSDRHNQPAVQLVPLGLAGDRRVLYGVQNGGPVLIAGLASAGLYTLLTALVVDRVRRRPPTELAMLTIARSDRLDPTLAQAPQQRAGFIDPAETETVSRVLADLGEQLRRRLERNDPDQPDVVLVVDEWAELPDCGPALDLLAKHGSSVGMHLIAATAQLEDPRLEQSVGLFETRLVLQVADASASTRLLGQPGAEDLDRIGQVLPYLQGEVLARMRGFCVPPLYVEDLVARMRARAVDEARRAVFEAEPEQPVPEGGVGPTDAAIGQSILDRDCHCAADAPKSAQAEDVESGEREVQPADADRVRTVQADDEAVDPPPSYTQPPLVRAVSMPARRVPPGPRPTPTPQAPPITAEFLGQDRIVVAAGHLATTAGVSWDLFRIVCCLPPGKASLLRVASLLYPSDSEPGQKAAIQRVRQNKSNLQKAWGTVLAAEDAKRVLSLDNGVLWVDQDLVSVDVHAFLAAIYDGNRARAAGRLDDAIADYRRVRALYMGPLLAGRDEDYEWLGVTVEGRLTLREAHRHQERLATGHLAQVLVAAGRPAEAALLYAELMRDPGPPDVEADELEQFVHRQYTFREECARAVFECCRLTRDLPSLTRTYRELGEVLRALAEDAGVDAADADADVMAPSALTRALYEEVYADLVRGASIAGD